MLSSGADWGEEGVVYLAFGQTTFEILNDPVRLRPNPFFLHGVLNSVGDA